MEMDQNKATNKTYHQAYPKFLEYNLLVKSKKETNLGSSSETLPDTVEMLEIRKIKVTRKILGQDDTLVTDVFAGNSVFWPQWMQDKQVILDWTAAMDADPHTPRHRLASQRHWHSHQQKGAQYRPQKKPRLNN